jgi:protein TonB
MSHADILDQPERLSRPLAGSVVLHVSLAAAILSYNWIASQAPVKWGDPNGGGIGSVAVTAVASIKLPSHGGPENPVANDTESLAPEAPAKKKVQPKVKTPEPDAIPIKSRNLRKRAMETASSQPNKFREQQKDLPNQVYSSGQATSSRMYNMSGGGGLQLGNDSPFGTEFGWYAKLLRDKVAQNWKTADLNMRQSLPPVTVTFTIQRDGTLKGPVQITQRSGNAALDYSAQRAVLDSIPFSTLPPQFSKNEAKVELLFNLK